MRADLPRRAVEVIDIAALGDRQHALGCFRGDVGLDVWSAGVCRDQERRNRLQLAESLFAFRKKDRKLSESGEAEAGSAGEQPAEEYSDADSSLR